MAHDAFPPDNELDDQINALLNEGPGSASPMEVYKPIWRAAQIQALSTRRLAVAIEQGSRAQDASTAQMKTLTHVGLAITGVGVVLALGQAILALIALL